MLMFKSLWSNLKDNVGFKCGSSTVAHALHFNSSSILQSWKFSSMLWRGIIRNNVRVVGDRV